MVTLLGGGSMEATPPQEQQANSACSERGTSALKKPGTVTLREERNRGYMLTVGEETTMVTVLPSVFLLISIMIHAPSPRKQLCGVNCANIYRHCRGQCTIKCGHLRPHCCSRCHYRWELSLSELAAVLRAKVHTRQSKEEYGDFH
jgi:hypothetical protein